MASWLPVALGLVGQGVPAFSHNRCGTIPRERGEEDGHAQREFIRCNVGQGREQPPGHLNAGDRQWIGQVWDNLCPGHRHLLLTRV